MTTASVDPLGPEAYRRIARVVAAETLNFNELVRLAGLDPATDFRHADLAGTSMPGADLRGFDFSFSDFRNVDLTDASIAGARFERADLAGTDLTKARGVRDAALALAIIQDATFAPELVVIPAGNFLMGSPESEEGRDDDESPRHEVRFAEPFALGAIRSRSKNMTTSVPRLVAKSLHQGRGQPSTSPGRMPRPTSGG